MEAEFGVKAGLGRKTEVIGLDKVDLERRSWWEVPGRHWR